MKITRCQARPASCFTEKYLVCPFYAFPSAIHTMVCSQGHKLKQNVTTTRWNSHNDVRKIDNGNRIVYTIDSDAKRPTWNYNSTNIFRSHRITHNGQSLHSKENAKQASKQTNNDAFSQTRTVRCSQVLVWLLVTMLETSINNLLKIGIVYIRWLRYRCDELLAEVW